MRGFLRSFGSSVWFSSDIASSYLSMYLSIRFVSVYFGIFILSLFKADGWSRTIDLSLTKGML